MQNNIKDYLDKARLEGKTITDIINDSGIGRTSFYEIMSGTQIPKLNTAVAVARALNAKLEDIFPELKEV